MPRRSPFHVPTRPIRRVACGAKPCGTLVRMVVRGLPCCLGSELGSLRGSLCDDPHPVESRIIGHFAKLQLKLTSCHSQSLCAGHCTAVAQMQQPLLTVRRCPCYVEPGVG